MSTKNDHSLEASKETEGMSPDDTGHQKANDDPTGFIVLFFIIGLIGSLIIGWIVFPKLLYSQKEQPFNFNHRLHMGQVDSGCESCHIFREDGTYAGTPKLAQCIDCHEDTQGESKDEATFVEEYVKKEREVPWLVYAKQPNCVFFSHAAHVKMAEIDCATCHGDVGNSTHLKTYEQNVITGYSRDIWGYNIAGLATKTSDRMKMDDCAKCHMETTGRQTSAQTKKDGCFVCHK